MSAVRSIARTDVAATVRSRWLWVATAGLAALVLLDGWGMLLSHRAEQVTWPFLEAVQEFKLWIPPFAIAVGYRSVTDGSQSKPNPTLDRNDARRAAVIGTFLGRALVLAVAVSLGSLAVAAVGVGNGVTAVSVVSGVGLAVLFGLAWLGATVGVATVAGTEHRTVAIAVGIFLLCAVLWSDLVVSLASLALTGATDPGVDYTTPLASLEGPTWYLYLTRLNPFDALDGALYYVPRLVESLAFGDPTRSPHAPNLFGLGVLIAWSVAPLVVAARLGGAGSE